MLKEKLIKFTEQTKEGRKLLPFESFENQPGMAIYPQKHKMRTTQERLPSNRDILQRFVGTEKRNYQQTTKASGHR